MITDRRAGNYSNQVISVDTRHRFTSADSLTLTVARSATEYGDRLVREFGVPRHELSDAAVEFHYGHSERNWYTDIVHRNYGDDFRADLGFISQVDYRYTELGGGWVWHSDANRFFNRMQVGGNIGQMEEQDGRLLEREAEVYWNYNGPNESFARWGGGVRERMFGGVIFDQVFQAGGFEMRASPDVYWGLGYDWRDWIDFIHVRAADEVTIRPFLNYNAGRHIFVRFNHTYNTLDVRGGRLFTANVPETRIVYQHSARTFFRAILQYTDIRRTVGLYQASVDRVSRNFFTQFLFSYKVNAQTVLYLGYSDTYIGSSTYDFTQANRTFFVKAGYAWLK